MEQGLLALAIIGTISALKMTGVINGWVTVGVAVLLGALAGAGGIEGLSIVSGILTGLASVGTVTVVDRISNK